MYGKIHRTHLECSSIGRSMKFTSYCIRDFIYKLSEVNSCDSSGSVIMDLGAQFGGPWFEFFDIFIHFFYPMVIVLLEHLNPVI